MHTLFFLLLSLVSVFLFYKIISKSMICDDRKERLFFSFSFYFILVSLLSLILVIFERYSLRNLLLAHAVVLLAFIILNFNFKWISISFKFSNITITKKDISIHNILLFLLIACGLFLYAWFPTEYIIGGRDQGVYVSEAVLISNTGGLQYEDEFLNKYYDHLNNVIDIGYPGFYSSMKRGLSDEPGEIVPQFLPLFPSLLALYYDLFGFDGLFRLNALIGLLAVLSIYFFTRRLAGNTAAILASFLVLLNPSEIWNARITQTELLSQFLFFSSLCLFIRGFTKNNSMVLITSGFILGLSCFNRIDSHLFGLGVFALLIYVAVFNTSKLKNIMKFTISYTCVSLLSIVYGFKFSSPYFNDLWISGSLSLLLRANGLLLIISIISILLVLLFQKNRNVKLIKYRDIIKAVPFIVVGILYALFVFAYFVRPKLLDPKYEVGSDKYFQYNSMIEFTWYVPVIAILMAFSGLFFLIKKKSIQLTGLFVVISLASIIGYLYDPSITPDHLWASRRWITVNIPALLILFSISFIYVFKRIRNHANLLVTFSLVAFVIIFSVYQSRIFLFQSMLKDYSNQFQQLASIFEDDSIIFSRNSSITTTLKFVFNKNAYTLLDEVDESQLLSFIETSPNKVYSINWNPTYGNGITSKTVYHQLITGKYVEKSIGYYPTKTYDRNFDLKITLLSANQNEYTQNLELQNFFHTQIGQLDSMGNYISNGKKGFLLYGPYIKITAGRYKINFTGSLEKEVPNEELGFVDVVSNKGKTIINRVPLTKEMSSIEFSVDQKIEDFEFRIFLNEGVVFKIENVTLQKLN